MEPSPRAITRELRYLKRSSRPAAGLARVIYGTYGPVRGSVLRASSGLDTQTYRYTVSIVAVRL